MITDTRMDQPERPRSTVTELESGPPRVVQFSGHAGAFVPLEDHEVALRAVLNQVPESNKGLGNSRLYTLHKVAGFAILSAMVTSSLSRRSSLAESSASSQTHGLQFYFGIRSLSYWLQKTLNIKI